MLERHQLLLQGVQGFDILASRGIAKHACFDTLQFQLQFVDDRKVAIDDGIDDGVQHEAGALLQQLRFTLAARPHCAKA